MTKNLPELPEWELNNMMMTIFGMLQPGHPLILGVKYLCQDVTVNGDPHEYKLFHRGNIVIRFFSNAVAQHFIDRVNGVKVFHENFQNVKNLVPHMKSNPGEGESCWCQTRVEAEFVDTTAPLSVSLIPSAPRKITERVVKLRLATRSPPRVRSFTAEGQPGAFIL